VTHALSTGETSKRLQSVGVDVNASPYEDRYPLQQMTVLERCSSRLRQGYPPGVHRATSRSVHQAVVARQITKHQPWNGGVGDVALRRTGTKRGKSASSSATACNVREVFVASLARKAYLMKA
jgi:hypothetical protein